MSAVPSQRRVRQVVQKQGAVLEQAIPAIQQLLRERPDVLNRLAAVEGFARKSFLERLRWLFTGQ